MREILQFFLYRSYILLFLVLETIALLLVVNYNNRQKTIFSYNVDVLNSKVKDMRQGTADYFHLKSANQKVLEENAELRAKLKTQSFKSSASTGIDSSVLGMNFDFGPARVIQNTTSRAQNYILINRGTKDGISIGDGVISDKAVVGIIHSVTENYARALSCLNRNTRISAGIEGTDFFGYLEWEPFDIRHMMLKGIPKHANITTGDKIIVQNSLIFPIGYAIGSITESTLTPGSNFYEIEVQLAEDFSQLTTVYVLKNRDMGELKNLLIQ